MVTSDMGWAVAVSAFWALPVSCALGLSESGRGVASFLFWLLQRQPASFDGQQLQQQQRWMMMDDDG